MHKHTLNFKQRVFEGYSGIMALSFYLFMFCVLSFGRAFSVFHLQTPYLPFYITEIFLLLNIPFLFYKYKSLAKLPRLFLMPAAIFFILGCVYLITGMLKQNLFALRDITVFGYILFLPLAFIHLNSLKRVKYLIILVILSNIINLYTRQCLMLGIYPSETLRNFMLGFKSHQMGLCFGIENAFIIAFYASIKPRIVRLLALIVLSLNICMLILFSSSSLWIAVASSLAFLFFMLKRKFLNLAYFFAPIFILTSLIIFHFDFKRAPETYQANITGEGKGFKLFFNKLFSYIKPAQQAPAEVTTSSHEQPAQQSPAEVTTSPHEQPAQQSLAEVTTSPHEQPAQQSPAEVTTSPHEQPVQQSPAEVTTSPHEQPAQQAPAQISPALLPLENKSAQTSSVTEEIDPAFGNISWRLNIWRQTIKFTMDSPLFGKGFGVYPVYKIWTGFQSPKHIFTESAIVPAHNHLLTVFLKMGILGLGLFLFIIIYVFVYALSYVNKCKLKLINNLLIALLGALVFWHTFALLFDIIDSPPTSIFLWIIMGFIFGAVEIDKYSTGV